MNIAVIPARGGSKRIPRKNIKLFHGKPIIAYSIEVALHSGCFDKVIVSTDDREIAQVAKNYGAEVPFLRSANIADDYATTADVIQDAILWYENNNINIRYLCCIYATAPFITTKLLQQGLKILQEEKCEFVFSATAFPFPIQRAFQLSKQGEVFMCSPENEQIRSQDLKVSYHDAGQFYWGKKTAFLEKKSIFAPNSKVIILPKLQAHDIDTFEDWNFAEALYAFNRKNE